MSVKAALRERGDDALSVIMKGLASRIDQVD